MSTAEQTGGNRIYYKIVDGKFCRKVDRGTEGARAREWLAGGKTGTSYELVYDHIRGFIKSVAIRDNEYDGNKFTTLDIYLDEDEQGRTPVISVGIKTRFALDLMYKLPSIDLSKEVVIRPYSFMPEDSDREKIGVSVLQKDEQGLFKKKIVSYFFVKEGDSYKAVNGIPERNKPFDEQSESEREIFKIQRLEFLRQYITENVISKLQTTKHEQTDNSFEYPEEEINPEDIPF